VDHIFQSLPVAFYVHHLSPFFIQLNENFGIRWYGIAYISGFVAAFFLMKWLARKGYGSLQENQVSDFIFYAALFGVLVGGRLGYVLFYRPTMLAEDPLGRVGEHSELADLASFLVSDSAGYINGEMVVQDGGAHLRSSGAEDLLQWTDAQWEKQRTARSKD